MTLDSDVLIKCCLARNFPGRSPRTPFRINHTSTPGPAPANKANVIVRPPAAAATMLRTVVSQDGPAESAQSSFHAGKNNLSKSRPNLVRRYPTDRMVGNGDDDGRDGEDDGHEQIYNI